MLVWGRGVHFKTNCQTKKFSDARLSGEIGSEKITKEYYSYSDDSTFRAALEAFNDWQMKKR